MRFVRFAFVVALVLRAGTGFAEPRLDLPEEALPRPPSPPESESQGAPSLFGSLGQRVSSLVRRTALGGYGEFVFTKPEGLDSSFDARRFVLFLYAPIHPRISVASEIEFEFGGTPKKSMGEMSDGEVILEFATIDVTLIEALKLRAGIVLVPFGKWNVNHDSPSHALTDRPLVIRTIVPSTWFETGAGLFGDVSLPAELDLHYEVYAINGLDSRIQDGLGNRAARGALSEDNNDDKAVVGRVGLAYFGDFARKRLSLEIGASAYSGAYDRRGHRANLVGADLTLRRGSFEFMGEYVRQWNDAGFDDSWASSSRAPIPEGMAGFYVQANYHFMPDVLRAAMPADWKEARFTAVAFYEEVDTDVDRDTAQDRTRLVFGLSFRPIQAVVFKNELQFNYALQPGGRSGELQRRSFFGVGDPLRPSMDYVTSLAFLF